MVVDTSALLAVLFAEADGEELLGRIVGARRPIMSATDALEAGIVADHHPKPSAGGDLDDLMDALGIEIEPVTAAQVRLARRAYRVYGRGNHPAALNSATASPTPWPRRAACRSCSRASTSRAPT